VIDRGDHKTLIEIIESTIKKRNNDALKFIGECLEKSPHFDNIVRQEILMDGIVASIRLDSLHGTLRRMADENLVVALYPPNLVFASASGRGLAYGKYIKAGTVTRNKNLYTVEWHIDISILRHHFVASDSIKDTYTVLELQQLVIKICVIFGYEMYHIFQSKKFHEIVFMEHVIVKPIKLLDVEKDSAFSAIKKCATCKEICFRQCGKCKKTYYCGKACLVQDAKRHSGECGRIC
jgi:hypothetical protein